MAEQYAKEWFQTELEKRSKPQGIVKTVLTTGYKILWTEDDALRELVQNFIDGIQVAFGCQSRDDIIVMTADFLIQRVIDEFKDRGIHDFVNTKKGQGEKGTPVLEQAWNFYVDSRIPDERRVYAGTIAVFEKEIVIHQEQCVLSERHLMFQSDKSNGLAGGFGEGFKLGILVLLKSGAEVYYDMHGQRWIFGLTQARDSLHKTFVIDCKEDANRSHSMQIRIVKDSGFFGSPTTMTLKQSFMILDKGSFVGDTIPALSGQFYKSPFRGGSVYVNGILVQKSDILRRLKLALGLENQALNRDRDSFRVPLIDIENKYITYALRETDTGEQMMQKLIKECVAEGKNDEAAAFVTARLMSLTAVRKEIERRLEIEKSCKIYLDSNFLSRGHRAILKKLDYVLVKSGWLKSLKPFDAILSEMMTRGCVEDTELSSEKRRSNLTKIRLMFDTFARVNSSVGPTIKAWRPPPKLVDFYDKISVPMGDNTAYVPENTLSIKKAELFFGVVLTAANQIYPSSRTLRKIVDYFFGFIGKKRKHDVELFPTVVSTTQIDEWRLDEMKTEEDLLAGHVPELSDDEDEIHEEIEAEEMKDDEDTANAMSASPEHPPGAEHPPDAEHPPGADHPLDADHPPGAETSDAQHHATIGIVSGVILVSDDSDYGDMDVDDSSPMNIDDVASRDFGVQADDFDIDCTYVDLDEQSLMTAMPEKVKNTLDGYIHSSSADSTSSHYYIKEIDERVYGDSFVSGKELTSRIRINNELFERIRCIFSGDKLFLYFYDSDKSDMFLFEDGRLYLNLNAVGDKKINYDTFLFDLCDVLAKTVISKKGRMHDVIRREFFEFMISK